MKKENGNKDSGIGVFIPVEIGEEKTLWNRIGRAFVNSKGLSLLLDAVPVGGRAVVLSDEIVVGDGAYRVLTPVEYEKDGEKKTRWTRVGTALGNKKGLTVLFTAHPVNGKAVVILTEEKEEGGEKEEELSF